MKLTLLKIALSLPIGYALILPFISNAESGVLREVELLGPFGATLFIIAFLMVVALYCLSLQKTLRLVDSQNQVGSAKSVWWMFALPYNFIEDFFIMYRVATSVKKQAQSDISGQASKLSVMAKQSLVLGMVWCGFQIVALLPNMIGQIAGLIAIIAWIWHWVIIARINHLLRSNEDEIIVYSQLH